jgi:hypothetical protein
MTFMGKQFNEEEIREAFDEIEREIKAPPSTPRRKLNP